MDILIKNAEIIYRGRGNIGITGDRISYIGTGLPDAARTMDASGMIAMPGLFNAHTHSSMVLMRNSVADRKLEQWLSESIFPVEARLRREHIRDASLLAMAEMIRSGTVGFMDMYYFADMTAEAVLEAGMKANLSIGLLTSGNNMDSMPSKENSIRFINDYRGAGNGRLATSLEVHSVYLYDEEGLRESAGFAEEHGLCIHAHLHETEAEVKNSIEKYGQRPIEVFGKTGLLDCRVVAAHCVHMNESDLEAIREKGVIPVHCPSSNMFLGSGFAPVPEMLGSGIPAALGTDGAASNNDLDMFGEMNLAGLVHKGNTGDATVMDAGSVLGMATANGAAALGFSDSGMLGEGYKADIILVDAGTCHNTPLLNPVNALVYSTKGSDVDTVIVDGRILMEGKELLTIDEEKAKYGVRKMAEELM